MWRNDTSRRDDPQVRGRETRRLARDEYDRPTYGNAPGQFGPPPEERTWQQDRETRDPWVRGDHRGPEDGGRDYHANETHTRSGSIEQLPVHEIMTRRVTSVHPATSVERAARLMDECDCGALPVIGDNGVLVGVVTDRDITIRVVARGRDSHNAIVADCMTDRVFACYATESVAECMRQMAYRQVRRMPIVDDRGRLVGIVSQGDLARHAGREPVPEERRAVAAVVGAVSQPGQPYR